MGRRNGGGVGASVWGSGYMRCGFNPWLGSSEGEWVYLPETMSTDSVTEVDPWRVVRFVSSDQSFETKKRTTNTSVWDLRTQVDCIGVPTTSSSRRWTPTLFRRTSVPQERSNVREGEEETSELWVTYTRNGPVYDPCSGCLDIICLCGGSFSGVRTLFV